MRRALSALGHDVWSCDTLPAEDRSNHHITGDIRDVLNDGWDMAIMHPPCTRLTNSGVRWLSEPPTNPPPGSDKLVWPLLDREARLEVMQQLLREGAALFSDCWNAPIPKIAVENPVMHKHAKALIRNYQPPAQTVQPWWFGEPAFKGTSFYLKGLPPLTPTDRLVPPKAGTPEHKSWSAIHMASPGPLRWQIRSRTFQGIADAMASQWG